MVKRELKGFELKVNEKSFPCTTPCTVKSVLSAAGEKSMALGSEVSFNAVISADEAALSIKYFYLRLKGIKHPCKLYIGDEKICELDGTSPVYNVNISGLVTLGDNILSLRFSAADGDITYAGVYGSVEIIRFNSSIIDRVNLTRNIEDGRVNLGINLQLLGDTSSVRAVATLVSPGGQIYYAGLTGGKGSVIITDPLYWWPRGLGVQNIYRLTVNLYGESDVEDSLDMRLGLRSVENTEGFGLKINGIKMILMGAVYIPDREPDPILADKKSEEHISAAAKAGYNCFVIPSGSNIPSDRFYELCDLYGIAVIEEHKVIDDDTVNSLRERIDHPSLCLIDLISSENLEIYESRLKDSFAELKYKILPSPYEYISMPALPSMKSISEIVPEGERSLFSRSIEAIAEDGAIKDMLLSVADRYPYPRDLSSFAYASALASCHKVGEVVRSARLTGGKSVRGVFNRLSDFSLAISSSAIDYRGRWKPIQYYCYRYFAPITLYADIEDGVAVFSASNLRKFDLIGSLEYRIADASNYTVFKSSEPMEISAFSEGKIHFFNISEIIKGHESEYYLEYYLKEGHSSLAKGVLLFLPEKHFDFKKPNISANITGQDKKFVITLSTDKFVKDLEIGFDGIDGVFSDNYIDLTGEIPVKIDFTVNGNNCSASELAERLEIRSVWDLK